MTEIPPVTIDSITDDLSNLSLIYTKYHTMNIDKSTFKNSNDEPTPLACVDVIENPR